MPRPIIAIDEDKCNGCGQCILDCAEGALAIVDGKARLISETYCDGLGACLNCPMGALSLAMRDARPFDEEAALAAKRQREKGLVPLGMAAQEQKAHLDVWPIQLELVLPTAQFLRGAPLLLAAHCAGFAARDIQELMKNHVPVIACPKLQKQDALADRLTAILKANETPAITILRMSVPCCALPAIVEKALKNSGASPRLATRIVKLN